MGKSRRLMLAFACSLFVLGSSTVLATAAEVHRGRQPIGPATLYEVTERVVFDAQNGVVFRDAVASLMGFARLGTPLCPTLALVTRPDANLCTVLGVGQDDVSTSTGLGPVSGTFAVVVNAPGNSSVHVPDLPILVGTFQGNIDMSPAILARIPLGSITGTFTIFETQPGTGRPMTDAQGNPLPPVAVVPFSGTFRLPFALDAQGQAKRPDDEVEDVFYLADDGRFIRVRANERDLGYPAVRLEVRFAQ